MSGTRSHTHTHTHPPTYECTCTRANLHKHLRAYIHMYIYVYTRVYAHSDTLANTPTPTCTHSPTRPVARPRARRLPISRSGGRPAGRGAIRKHKHGRPKGFRGGRDCRRKPLNSARIKTRRSRGPGHLARATFENINAQRKHAAVTVQDSELIRLLSARFPGGECFVVDLASSYAEAVAAKGVKRKPPYPRPGTARRAAGRAGAVKQNA